MVAPNSEYLEFDIRLQAREAITQLQELTSAATSFQERVALVQAQLQQFSTNTGMSFRAAKSYFQEMDQTLAETGQQSAVFGSQAKQGWIDVGNGAQQATGGINLMRTALHVLAATAIFEVINAFRLMFSEALAGLKSLEVSVYNLSNAERSLSESGINVTFKELEAVVDRLHQKFDGLFSKVQLQDAVADIAIATKELGLSVAQIQNLAQVSATLQLRNPDKTLQEVNQQVLTAVLSGQTKGLRSLGAALDDTKVKEEAVALGLAKATDSVSTQAKSIAEITLLYQQFKGEANNLGQYQNNLSGATQELSSTWQDFLTQLAKVFGPEIIAGIKILTMAVMGWMDILNRVFPLLQGIAAVQIGLIRATEAYISVVGRIDLSPMEKSKRIIDAFKQGVSDTNAYFKQFTDNVDTATAAVDKFGAAFDSAGFSGEIQKIITDISRAFDDLATQLARKQEDLNTEYVRKAQDALLDYQRKIEDIQREGATRIQDIRQHARQEDQNREARYQLALWELQQKYLMNLEDALHNRDARAILRLQRQYAFDKEDLARKNALDARQHAQQVANEIRQAQEDTKRKLEQARLEYERKLQDLAIAKAREQADLQTWYKREQDDLRTSEQRKIQDLINSWVQQGKITQQGAQQVYAILRRYFGPGGMTDQLYAYMQSQLQAAMMSGYSVGGGLAPIGSASGGIVVPTSGGGQVLVNTTSTTGGTPPMSSNGGNTTSMGTPAGGLAEGGSYLATRPTTIRVGENRPEMIQTTPLGRAGQDLNKLFMNASLNNGQGGGGGQLELGVSLSPDLETRIIRKTLDETAGVVLLVNKSKI